MTTLREELDPILRRYDKKEFTLSEAERLATYQGEMTQEMQDSLLAKELLHHLETFDFATLIWPHFGRLIWPRPNR